MSGGVIENLAGGKLFAVTPIQAARWMNELARCLFCRTTLRQDCFVRLRRLGDRECMHF